ncbi:hypothetical protein CANCADRAFT_144955 [Tortispora caseinolytica NRRL Y-17796]|uniref:OPT family small oligopeptide transporter n=1 Tax=Tortispora caseinolytica NRRL Y-17796 TaxID=767744 RepID=A0A1E4T9C7_9ASCO|nr:hypothetical protein CANCADRAFT_144955 [Tortispora caseinolytica NRRL Y-17796]
MSAKFSYSSDIRDYGSISSLPNFDIHSIGRKTLIEREFRRLNRRRSALADYRRIDDPEFAVDGLHNNDPHHQPYAVRPRTSESVNLSDLYRPRLSDTSDIDIVEDVEFALSDSEDDFQDFVPHNSTDHDPFTDTNTLRMWVLTLLLAVLGSAMNLFFSLRYPSITISPTLALLAAHPLGLLWDRIFPESLPESLPASGFLARLRNLAGKGRWNGKEHALVYIGANVSFGFAYATDIIVEQTKFYNASLGILYQIGLLFSSQVMGYAFAGFAQKILIEPASMIWPSTLVPVSLLDSFHSDSDVTIASRVYLFKSLFAAGAVWYLFPGLFAPFLSYFNVLTWLNPSSPSLSALFGTHSGLGMFPISFDWAQISYLGSPILTPWWAQANVLVGLVIFVWLICGTGYFKNWFYSSYMPVSSPQMYDRFGQSYNTTRILTPDFKLDEQAYKDYSPVYLSMTYVCSYAAQFAALGAVATYVILYHGKQIVSLTKRSPSVSNQNRQTYSNVNEHDANTENDPAHSTPPSNVPETWFFLVFIVCFLLAYFVVKFYPMHVDLWQLIIAIVIAVMTFLPVSFIYAITNQFQSTYLAIQILAGYLLPGNPMGNMMFLAYGYITASQGMKFSADLKLGQYMKLAPRLLFSVQIISTLVAGLTQIIVLNLLFLIVPDMCFLDAESGFSCPFARVHFNGTLLWGVVGPWKFFSMDHIYWILPLALPTGIIVTVIVYLLYRSKPKSWIQYVHIPVLLGGLTWIPPANGLNVAAWGLFGFIFNYLVKQRHPGWWKDSAMTVSAALDSSLALCTVCIFVLFHATGISSHISWWGTEVYKQTCDWKSCALVPLKDNEWFGPP